MKKLIKTMSLILAIMTASSMAACKPNEEDSSGGLDDSSGGSSNTVAVEWTDHDLVSQGMTDYVAVLPDEAHHRQEKAYSELNTFFTQATGTMIDLKYESEVTYSEDAKLIVLGDCEELQAAAGVVVDSSVIGINGYVMKTVDSNLFIAGGTQYGTLFGVYDFLRYTFNYEVYAADEIVIDTGVANRKLLDINEVRVPEIQQLWANYGWMWNDTEFAIRMGFEQNEEIFICPGGRNVHNFYEYVDPDVWGEEYPEWFQNSQLCLSNEEMYELAMLPNVKKWIQNTPDISNITITQMDVPDWCKCDECTAERTKYGTDAGIMIKFMNKISRDVNEWLKTEDPGRELTFLFFAYHASTTKPPVKLNETTGKYEPIDEEVICEDDVGVFFAPVYSQFTYSFYDEANREAYLAAEGWSAICKRMFVWSYETNFSQYLVPYNTFNSIQENFKFYKEHNVRMLFSQGQHNQNAGTCFTNLKTWLNSKFRWDVNADYEALLDEFFENYFGEGAEGMREYFDNLRIWFDYQENELSLPGGIYATTSTSIYWPKGILDSFTNSIDKALAAIEPLKNSAPERYQQLYDRISLESFTVRYLLEKIYPFEYTEEGLYNLRKGLKDDILRLGMTRISEKEVISTLYANWGI